MVFKFFIIALICFLIIFLFVLYNIATDYSLIIKIWSFKPFRHKLPNYLIQHFDFRKLVMTEEGLFTGLTDSPNTVVKRDHLNREVLVALTTNYTLINVYPFIFYNTTDMHKKDLLKPFKTIVDNRIHLFIDPKDAVRKPTPLVESNSVKGSYLVKQRGANKKFNGMVEISPADILVYTYSQKHKNWKEFFESNEKWVISKTFFYF